MKRGVGCLGPGRSRRRDRLNHVPNLNQGQDGRTHDLNHVTPPHNFVMSEGNGRGNGRNGSNMRRILFSVWGPGPSEVTRRVKRSVSALPTCDEAVAAGRFVRLCVYNV